MAMNVWSNWQAQAPTLSRRSFLQLGAATAALSVVGCDPASFLAFVSKYVGPVLAILDATQRFFAHTRVTANPAFLTAPDIHERFGPSHLLDGPALHPTKSQFGYWLSVHDRVRTTGAPSEADGLDLNELEMHELTKHRRFELRPVGRRTPAGPRERALFASECRVHDVDPGATSIVYARRFTSTHGDHVIGLCTTSVRHPAAYPKLILLRQA